jgi:transcriptional regulator with XRE-family HTH domain
MKRTKTRDALEILDRLTGGNESLRDRIVREELNAQVSRMIYEARTKAGLSQRQLAELVGTKQPLIARLEDADYRGHSLSMLQGIARALNKRLDVRFVEVAPRRRGEHLGGARDRYPHSFDRH